MSFFRFVLLSTLLFSGAAAASDAPATWLQKVITPETALKAALAAKTECRKHGWQVTVTVTDPAGLPLVTLRDRYAGWHTIETADGKARTAASWRTATGDVAARVNKPGAPERAIVNLPGVVMVGGGLPIWSSGQLAGAIGVSGAPGGENDEICAKAGLAAIPEDLEF